MTPAFSRGTVARMERPRVLVADDAELNQTLLCTLLKKWGFDAKAASDGDEAVEAALGAMREGRPFGVILMDKEMPALDGYAATAALRARGYRGAILAFTARADDSERALSLAAGCDELLPKPIDWAVLRATVERYATR